MRSRIRNLIPLLTLALSACGSPAATTQPTSPIVTVAPTADENVSSDPVLTIATLYLPTAPSDPVTGYPSYGEGERLLYPAPGTPKPWLATSVEMTDPQSWRITLRDSVRFQNGAAMTAEKVARWLDGELKNDYDPGLYIDAVVGVDGDHVVTVTFPTPQPGFGIDLAYFSLPVYDVDALKSIGDDYTQLAGLGIFTGPYMLTEITPTRWTYTRNPTYWAGMPALEQIVKIGINDEQAGIRAVQNGEADIVDLVSPKLKPTVEAIPGLHFVTGDPALQPEFVALRPNLDRAPWSDLVVRHALALAIDSEDVSAKSSFGVFTPIKGIFPPDSTRGLNWMSADLDEANRILDEAGWVLGSDGVRAKDGVRLAGELLTSEEMLNDVSVVVAENAKRAGFELTPALGEAQGVYDRVSTGSFDLAMIYGQNMGYDGDPSAFCDMFDPNYSYAGSSAVQDPSIRAACDQLLQSRDTAVIEQVVQDVQQRNADEVFVVPVVGFIPASVTNDAWAAYKPNYWFDMIGWQTKSK